MKSVFIRTDRLLIRDLPPRAGHHTARFHRENRHFHHTWEPAHPEHHYTAPAQRRILVRERRSANILHLWMLPASGKSTNNSPIIIGSITLSSIVRGFFQSCFLGYKLDAKFAGRGYMHEALSAVVQYAFSNMGLHRLEANIMPNNARSLKLAADLGFNVEGTSPRYLNIQGRWEDHMHLVILREGNLDHESET